MKPDQWDEFGSTLRNGPGRSPAKFVDLRPITARVIPAVTPAGLHFYLTEDLQISSYAFVCKSTRCRGYSGANKLLAEMPGVHHLMWIKDISDSSSGPDAWIARFGTVTGEPAERSFIEPMNVVDILAGLQRAAPRAAPMMKEELELGLERYPHKCPRCNGPAYVGLNSIDCIMGC